MRNDRILHREKYEFMTKKEVTKSHTSVRKSHFFAINTLYAILYIKILINKHKNLASSKSIVENLMGHDLLRIIDQLAMLFILKAVG